MKPIPHIPRAPGRALLLFSLCWGAPALATEDEEAKARAEAQQRQALAAAEARATAAAEAAASAAEAATSAAARADATATELEELRERLRTVEAQLDQARDDNAVGELSQAELPLDLETHVHGYAAITLDAGPEDPAGFTLDELVFTYGANLERKVTFHSELAFEPGEDAVAVDIETVEFRYLPYESFGVRAGRVHAPSSWWASTALHGAHRYLPVSAPKIMALEDYGGGYLPIHQVGVYAEGTIPVGLWGMQYIAGTSNGRSPVIGGIGQAGDWGWGKALTGRISLASPTGLTVGLGGYTDLIEPGDAAEVYGESMPVLGEAVSENVAGYHFSFKGPRIELASEALVLRHKAESSDVVNNFGAYGLLGLTFGDVTPYIAADTVQLDPFDPIYAHAGDPHSSQKASLGVRYAPGLRVSLKVQADYGEEMGYEPNPHGDLVPRSEKQLHFATQLAGGF